MGKAKCKESQNKRKQVRKQSKKVIPKPGEKGFKTSTQLRNERKRRAKKKEKSGYRQTESESVEAVSSMNIDPSLLYVKNPRKAPLVQKAVHFFAQQNVPNFTVFCGPAKAWRTVAKLAVRNVNNELTVGLFAPGSHNLVAVPDCPAHHPSVNCTVDVLQETARRSGIRAFDEVTGTGNLRHVAINVERATGSVQLTLVWKFTDQPADATTNKEESEALDRLCKKLIQQGTSSKGESSLTLHSLWVHYNAAWKHDNAIFNHTGRWEHRHGPKSIVENLAIDDLKIPLQFPPNVFRQANLDAFTGIIRKIRNVLQERASLSAAPPACVELYGGVGTLGLHVADLCRSLVSSDENPHNKACFEETVRQMKVSDGSVSYKSLNATEMVNLGVLNEADWIVVDPPRKGLDDVVLGAMAEVTRPQILVYVSCGFDAFQRDCKYLVQHGQWEVLHAEGHILFPGSDAIETLAFFVRRTDDDS